MSVTESETTKRPAAVTPTEQFLTAALIFAPLLSLAADATYAATSWHNATAGVLHVIGATAYGFVVWRVATWLPRESVLGLSIIVTGVIGLAGNVAYGFDTIHMSLGDTALVDQAGAANLIKPYGLFFPLSVALMAWGLARLGNRWQSGLVLLAALAWPVAHIANIAWLAVAVNMALVVGFGSLVWAQRDRSPMLDSARVTS
jgi:hypothetical protein